MFFRPKCLIMFSHTKQGYQKKFICSWNSHAFLLHCIQRDWDSPVTVFNNYKGINFQVFSAWALKFLQHGEAINREHLEAFIYIENFNLAKAKFVFPDISNVTVVCRRMRDWVQGKQIWLVVAEKLPATLFQIVWYTVKWDTPADKCLCTSQFVAKIVQNIILNSRSVRLFVSSISLD